MIIYLRLVVTVFNVLIIIIIIFLTGSRPAGNRIARAHKVSVPGQRGAPETVGSLGIPCAAVRFPAAARTCNHLPGCRCMLPGSHSKARQGSTFVPLSIRWRTCLVLVCSGPAAACTGATESTTTLPGIGTSASLSTRPRPVARRPKTQTLGRVAAPSSALSLSTLRPISTLQKSLQD